MMTMARRALATLMFLAASLTTAFGQVPSFPQTLPANSLVGRLGIGPGPSQAIPFSAALQAILALGGGTSGHAIPFLDGNNTWSGSNIFAPPAATLTQAISVLQSGAGTVAGEISYNEINVSSDTASTTTSNNTAAAMRIRYGFGGAALSGSRSGIEVDGNLNAPSPSNSNANYVAGYFNMNANTGDGGTDLGSGARGVLTGLNPVVRIQPGATNIRGGNGAEFDLIMNSGASAQALHGVDIVRWGNQAAAVEDSAINIYNAGDPAVTWTKVLQLKHNGGPPVAAGGCVFCTDGSSETISTYAEAAAYNFTDFIFRFKNFQVTGTGLTTASAFILSSTLVPHTAGFQFSDGTNNGFFGGSSDLTNSVGIGSINSVPVTFVTNSLLAGSISTTGVWNIGKTGTLTGIMGFSGSTSGTATIAAQPAAGAPTLLLPNTGGTFAASATAPITLDATTGAVGCSTCLTASGNAATATALQTARTIGGVSFNGTANITVASATGGFTVSGGDLALGTNNLAMTGSLGATGARLTKGWFTDLQVTNAIAGSITGNAATVTTNANQTGDVTSVGNATTIASHAVSNTKFRQSAALSIVGNSTNATADAGDIAASTDGNVMRRSGASIGFGTLDLTSTGTVPATAWTSYTNTLTPDTGTISQTGTSSYMQIGKTVFVSVDLTITVTSGTPTSITASLPVAVKRGTVITGKEQANTGKLITLNVPNSTGTSGFIGNYDNTSVNIATGARYQFNGVYEAN